MPCKCACRMTVVEHVWGKDGRSNKGGEGDSDFCGKDESASVGRVKKVLMMALVRKQGRGREESRDDDCKWQGSHQENGRRCDE
jgi:hypothetical protein